MHYLELYFLSYGYLKDIFLNEFYKINIFFRPCFVMAVGQPKAHLGLCWSTTNGQHKTRWVTAQELGLALASGPREPNILFRLAWATLAQAIGLPSDLSNFFFFPLKKGYVLFKKKKGGIFRKRKFSFFF